MGKLYWTEADPKKRAPKPPDEPDDSCVCCNTFYSYSGKVKKPAYDMCLAHWVIPTKQENCRICGKKLPWKHPQPTRHYIYSGD